MAAETLAPAAIISAAMDPSDAQLLEAVAAARGLMLGEALRLACLTFHAAPQCETRAERLAQILATYLHTWHVLRTDQATPDGVKAWAATANPVFLRAALAGCARHHREQGGA